MIINYPTYYYNNSDAIYYTLNISTNEPFNDNNEVVPLIDIDTVTTINYEVDETSEINQIVITHNKNNSSSINYYQVDDIDISDDFDVIICKLTITLNDKQNIYEQQYIDNYRKELLQQLYDYVEQYRTKRNEYNNIIQELSKINESKIHLTAINNVDMLSNEDITQQIDELNRQYNEYKEMLSELKQNIMDIISNIKKLKNIL